MSYGLWQSRFGGDPGIVGRSIQLGGRGVNTRTVIGVMHPDYRPISELWQFWVPMQVDPSNFPDYEGTAFLTVAGRLTDDATVEQAHVEVTRIAKLLAEEQSWLRRDPDLLNRAGVIPLLTSVVGDARTPMLVFLGVVSLLLLLTCANLANILLARAGNRTREVAVRMALGAGRARIFRQMITESVVLGLAGGLAGLLVGIWLLSILKGNLPVGTPRTGGIGIDGTVLFFTAGISLLSAVLYGLAPSFSSTRKDVHINLQEGRTGISITRRRYRINSILVAAEVAISVLLLTGAGLLIRSVLALHRVDPGFDTRNMVTMRLNPPGTAYPDSAAIYNYYQSVIERVGILSGVQSVSSIYYLPLTMENIGMLYEAESHPVAEGEPMPGANVRVVGNDYFPTMGIPRLEGAVLSSARPEGTPFEIVVNSSLARLYWPEGEATGNHIEMNGVTWTVVGVVGDVRQFRLSMASQPEIYIHHGLSPARQMYLVVRTGIDAKDMIAPLRDAVWSIDDDVPLSFVRTMDEVVRRSMSESRIYAVLLTCFGLVAFILGVIGVFGVVSYTTGQRTREIGIRLALGAVRPRIVGEVVRRALLPVGIGIAVGLAGAVGASQVIAGMLYGVSATDPMTYAGVLLLQVIVALVACYLPANRAAGSDPMSVLRVE